MTKFPPVPDNVRVLGEEYEVHIVPRTEMWNPRRNKYDFGEVCTKQKVIRIRGTLSRREQWTTLLHEILHILWEDAEARRKISRDIEEDIIEKIDTPLLNFLIANRILRCK